MVRALTLDYENDLGKLFENVIFLDLKRRGCKINYYLTKERYEIDFLATSPLGKRKLFQVLWSMDHESTLERENRALQAGMRN